MTAFKDFARRYGAIMTAYIFVACGVWMIGLIVLPQLLMVDYSLQYVDRTEESRLDYRIEQRYVDLQLAQSALRRLNRQLDDAAAGDRPALEDRIAGREAE